MVSDPLVDAGPCQFPLAIQLVVFSLDQLSVVDPLYGIDVWLALSDSVGDGGCTSMETVSLTLPPVPVQVSVNALSDVNDVIRCEPLVALLPDQSPDAEQALA